MNVAILAVSALSLIASATTLTVVIVGAKRVEHQVEEVRQKSNDSIKKLRNALNDLEV